MGDVIVTQLLDVPVEKVWNALSQEAELKNWYFPVQDYVFEEGKEFSFYESDDSHLFLHRCKFLSIIPGRLIECTWEHPSHSKGISILKWEVEPQEDKTLVRLTHSGIDNFVDAGAAFSKANYEMGWNAIVKTTLRNHLYGIERLVFDIEIVTTPAILWKKLWDNGNYTRWTEPFCEGTYITGKLSSGERVHFLSPSGEGMYSNVTFIKENELIVFSHIGMIQNGKELPIDSETEKWTGCFETYRLKQKGDVTCLKVEVDTIADYADHMKTAFPLALEKLKEISETNQPKNMIA